MDGNCNDIKSMISLYLDDELCDEDKIQFENHVKKCSECKEELKKYENIISVLGSMKNEKLPEGYCKRLHNRLVRDRKIIGIFNSKVSKTVVSAACLMLLMMGVIKIIDTYNYQSQYRVYDNLGFEGSSKSSDISYDYDTANRSYDTNQNYNNENNEYVLDNLNKKESKIIMSADLSIETDKYDDFTDSLIEKINNLSGYIEENNTYIYNIEERQFKNGYFKIRVENEKVNELIRYIEDIGKVINKNITQVDVTKSYYEKDNKVKNLEIQENKLREMFDIATTVEEMLSIENELRRVRTEIDDLNLDMANINSLSSMSTLSINVSEVVSSDLKKIDSDNFLKRAKLGFVDSVNNIINFFEEAVILIISYSPILLIVVIIISIILYIKKKGNKK